MEAPEATVEGQLGSTNCYRCEKKHCSKQIALWFKLGKPTTDGLSLVSYLLSSKKSKPFLEVV